MKIYKKSLSVGILCLFVFLGFLILANNVQAISDIDYEFENNVLFTSTDFPLEDVFNLRNETIATEVYNATHTFTGETGLTGLSIPFIDDITSTSAEILSSYDNHNEVLEVEGNGVSWQKIVSDFTGQTNGTTEFWIQLDVANHYTRLLLRQTTPSVENAINIYWETDGDLYYNDGTPHIICSYSADTWYHIRIDFECGANSYKGLSPDTFYIYVNGKQYGAYSFSTVVSTISRFHLDTNTGSTNLRYLDAIGYSWDNYYDVLDNNVPLFNTTNIKSVARDEFAFNCSTGTQHPLGVLPDLTYINGWYVDGYETDMNIIASEEGFDKEISVYSDTVHSRALTKTLDFVNNGVVNLTMKLTYLEMSNDASTLWWGMYSTTVVETALVRLYYTGGNIQLGVFNEDRATWMTLMNLDDSKYLVRNFNLFISGSKMCVLIYSDNSSVKETFYFPKIGVSNYLKKVIWVSTMNDDAGTQTFHIDSLSIKINGSGIGYVNDFFVVNKSLGSGNWNSKNHNLIKIDGTGVFSIGAYDVDNFKSIRSFYNYTEIRNINIYNLATFSLNPPSLAFIGNGTFSLNEIEIKGVRIKNGVDTFIPDYYSGSVDIDESYFYVDLNNRLQFNLICNDNYTEWIELRIALLTKTTENRSISFVSDINGVSQGYLHFAYWGYATTDIYFPYYLSTTTVFLPQVHIIFTFSIIISDFDITYYDNCSGYITNLKLINTPKGIQGAKLLPFDVSTLIAIMIPLIILLMPTLAISVKFGKKAILPMFVLMSLICVATDLIPIWIFFIIAISTGALIFGQYKRGNE